MKGLTYFRTLFELHLKQKVEQGETSKQLILFVEGTCLTLI